MSGVKPPAPVPAAVPAASPHRAHHLRRYVSPAVEIARHPWPFLVEVFGEFRRNHGLLLAGAVAYYMLLSIVPLLILLLVVLSNVLDPAALLATLARYLDLVVPGHTKDIVDDLAGFLQHRAAVSGVILLTILFFSSLAFGVLEDAFAVIFHHRRRERARSWLASALIPYAFIVVLAVGLVVITVVSGALQTLAVREFHAFGELRTFGVLSVWFIYLTGIAGEILLLTAIYLVMPAAQLPLRHALIGGISRFAVFELLPNALL